MDMMRQGWLMGVCEALQQLSMMLPQDMKTRPVSQRRIATCTNPSLCGFLWDWLQALHARVVRHPRRLFSLAQRL
jgi:hypothetical protein